MRLLGVELTRLRWRRAVLLLLLACLVVPALIFAVTAWNTRPVSGAELARAQQQVEQMRSETGFQRELRTCQQHPNRFGAASADECETQVGPQVAWFVSRSPLDLRELSRGLWPTVIVLLAGLLMLLGTTFAGADWNSGSMSNQLLFEPRRLRVWAAKAAAVLRGRRGHRGRHAAALLGRLRAPRLRARHRHRAARDVVHRARVGARGRAGCVRGAGRLRADHVLPQHRGHLGCPLRGDARRLPRARRAGRQASSGSPTSTSRRGCSTGCTTSSSRPCPARPWSAKVPTAAPAARSPRATRRRTSGVLLLVAVGLSMISFRRRDVP